MPSISVIDASGATQTIQTVPPVGQAVPSASLPFVVASAAPVDRSGTITSGGTAQTIAAASTARMGFSIQNLSTGDLWFNTLATAAPAQPSHWLPAGAFYESPFGGASTGAISIYGATTGQPFSAREW